MSKHTPGPWEAVYHMYSSTGGHQWEVRLPYSNGMPGDGIAIISSRFPSAFAEANARLIAAAPDLLTFAEYVAERIPELFNEEHIQGPARSVLDAFLADALTLIKKAGGK